MSADRGSHVAACVGTSGRTRGVSVEERPQCLARPACRLAADDHEAFASPGDQILVQVVDHFALLGLEDRVERVVQTGLGQDDGQRIGDRVGAQVDLGAGQNPGAVGVRRVGGLAVPGQATVVECFGPAVDVRAAEHLVGRDADGVELVGRGAHLELELERVSIVGLAQGLHLSLHVLSDENPEMGNLTYYTIKVTNELYIVVIYKSSPLHPF